MTGFAQIIHVMRKDLRQMRVLLLLYVVIIAIAAENALAAYESWNPMAAFVFIVGIVVVAGLVQADSPTRSDAFWATRPLHPMAVFGAKVATTAIIVLGVAVTAQAMVMHTFDVPTGVALPLLANSIRIYASWLLIAMIAAAATPDLRTFILALIGGAVVMWVGAGLAAAQQNMSAWTAIALGSIGVVCGVAFVVVLYRTRDVRRGTVLFGFIPVFCIVFPMGRKSPSADIEPEIQPTASIKVELRERTASNQLNLYIRLEGAQPRQRYFLRNADIVVFARGGDTLRMPLPLGTEQIALEGDSHMSPGISLRDPIPAVIDSIVLRGRLSVEALDGVDTLPMKLKASIVHDGRRTAIDKLGPFFGDTLFVLRTTWVDDGTNLGKVSSLGVRDVWPVKLINDVRHESIPLNSSCCGTSERMIILPGAVLRENSGTYTAGSVERSSRRRLVDSTWMSGAHVELTRRVPKGSYRVHDTFVVR